MRLLNVEEHSTLKISLKKSKRLFLNKREMLNNNFKKNKKKNLFICFLICSKVFVLVDCFSSISLDIASCFRVRYNPDSLHR